MSLVGSRTRGLHGFHVDSGTVFLDVRSDIPNPFRVEATSDGAYAACLGPRQASQDAGLRLLMLAVAPIHRAAGSGPNRLSLILCRLRSRRMGKPLGVAGRAFIRRPDGSVLLLRRAAKAAHAAGLWELPGGKIRHGESLFDGLAREVTEESGLVVEPDLAVHVGHQRVDPFWVTTITFDCGYTEQPVVLGDEHSEYLWATEGGFEVLSVTDGTMEQVRAGRRLTARVPDSNGKEGTCNDV